VDVGAGYGRRLQGQGPFEAVDKLTGPCPERTRACCSALGVNPGICHLRGSGTFPRRRAKRPGTCSDYRQRLPWSFCHPGCVSVRREVAILELLGMFDLRRATPLLLRPAKEGSHAAVQKDVKNRGNELNKLFRISKTCKKRTQNELKTERKTVLRTCEIRYNAAKSPISGSRAASVGFEACQAKCLGPQVWADHSLSTWSPRLRDGAVARIKDVKIVETNSTSYLESIKVAKNELKTNCKPGAKPRRKRATLPSIMSKNPVPGMRRRSGAGMFFPGSGRYGKTAHAKTLKWKEAQSGHFFFFSTFCVPCGLA